VRHEALRSVWSERSTAGHRSRPGIDPHRLIVVGHSEGGLFALWLADHLKGTPEALRMLVLAAPLGRRYLDVAAHQLTDQYHQAQAAGQLPAKDAATRIADLHRLIATLRATGKPPAHLADPALAPVLNPLNVAFLVQADRLDPAALARRLGPSLPVLVLRGTKDVQVDAGDIDHLMRGLAADRAVLRADIPDADHLFKVVTGTPNPPVDYANAGRPFAPPVAPRLAAFLAPLLGDGSGPDPREGTGPKRGERTCTSRTRVAPSCPKRSDRRPPLRCAAPSRSCTRARSRASSASSSTARR
jgi:uncharacterized protein